MHDRVFHHTKAHKLDDPERLKWLPPAEVLAYLPISNGTKVADVGTGSGYFALPLANAIGPAGHVFAVDLQSEMLELLQQKLERRDSPRNISLHQGSALQVPLPDGKIDLVFYANIWHEIDDPDAAFHEARRIVAAPKGTIAILDWREDKTSPPGPPPEHRISAASIVRFLEERGCRDISRRAVGDLSYLVIASLQGLR